MFLMMATLSASAQDSSILDETFSTEEGADTGSCTDSCGGQSEDGCWCDEYCSFYGDCCDARVAVCEAEAEPVTTCAGACGGESEDDCWCDESCEYYGDCCDDKSAVCDAYATPVTVTDSDGNQQEIILIDQDAYTQSNGLDDSLQAWRNFFELLVLLGSLDLEALGMNGSYEGSLVDAFGTPADAGLEINHSGSSVEGIAIVMENGLEVDAGYFCGGTFSLPVSLLYLEGETDSSGWTATGSTAHTVNVGGWWDVDVDVDWSFSMNQSDLETLTGTVSIDLPAVCSDTTLTGRFARVSIF